MYMEIKFRALKVRARVNVVNRENIHFYLYKAIKEQFIGL
jgi:hypothetical protein